MKPPVFKLTTERRKGEGGHFKQREGGGERERECKVFEVLIIIEQCLRQTSMATVQ